MLQVDRTEKKPAVGQDNELFTENQLTIMTLPQAEGNLNKKIRSWKEIANTSGPVYPVHGIVKSQCTCGDPNCPKPGKHPWTPHGYKDATTDDAQITEWVKQKPHANVGIATGGETCVIDVDGPPGQLKLDRLERDLGALPETWEVRTGRDGGRHLYFLKPAATRLKSRSIAPGLDIKAEGGGVVGPGSMHISGKLYTVLDEGRDMLELPEVWLDFLSKGSKPETKPDPPSSEVQIKKGSRNNKLFGIALSVWETLGEKEALRAAMQAFNSAKCDPPLPIEEVDGIVERACRNSRAFNGLPQTPITVTGAEVLAMQLPEVQWLVNGVIPPGVGLLVGKPKFGKSWLALNLAVAVVVGKFLFGRFAVTQGSVLYLALEDNHCRLQERLREMGVSDDEPFLSNIHFAIWWPTFDETHHGAEYVDKYIDEIGDCILLIIDLLENVRPGKKGNKSDYELAYKDLSLIKRLTQDRNITILILHHSNKGTSENPLDSVLGSTGLTGATDFVMDLQRDGDGSSPNGTLIVRGRDLKEDFKARLTLADGWWRWLGNADQLRQNENDNKVLAVLTSEFKAFTIIEKESGLKKGTCFGVLDRLVRDGLAIRGNNGKYRRAPEPDYAEDQDEFPF